MYHFFLGGMELPLAPEKYTMRLTKESQVLDMADGTQMSLLRPGGLKRISFEFLLPYWGDVPMVRNGVKVHKPIYYLNRLAEWYQLAEPRRLIIYRSVPDGEECFHTDMQVSLEKYQVIEAADLGFDVRVAVELLEYVPRNTRKYTGALAAVGGAR